MKLTLPWPPTVNHLHTVHMGRKILSSKARRWYEECGWVVRTQSSSSLDVRRVEIVIDLRPPSRRRYDIDNRIKPVLDVLVKNHIIPDDDCSVVRRLTVHALDYDPDIAACASVEIKPYE